RRRGVGSLSVRHSTWAIGTPGQPALRRLARPLAQGRLRTAAFQQGGGGSCPGTDRGAAAGLTLQRAPVSAARPQPRRRVAVLGTEISYIDTGKGAPVVFLHGNPTSSYVWRNVIPHVSPLARCLAPDLVGMGQSGKAPDGSYRLFDHQRYVDAWFDALRLEDVVLVVHDWGGPLGFSWAQRHEGRVRGLCYMETLLRPMSWEEWPESGRRVFKGMRSRAGEEMVLRKNVFV